MSKLDFSLYNHYSICVMRGIDCFNLQKNATQSFDIASLTKALVHLLILKLHLKGDINLNDKISKYIYIKQSEDRQIIDFLRFTVQPYGFDYLSLRNNPYNGDVDDFLTRMGFGNSHLREFRYDNIASVFLGILIKKITKIKTLESAINYLIDDEKLEISFHDREVHDPFAFNQNHCQLATAGIFSTSDVLVKIFYREISRMLDLDFYNQMSDNSLKNVDFKHNWAMGFDIPYANNPVYNFVERPLVFAGYTGCRIFFGIEKKTNKLIVVCILTDRVYKNDSPESRRNFSIWFWEYILFILKSQVE